MNSTFPTIRVLEIIKGLDVGGAERLLVERVGLTREPDLAIEMAVFDRNRLALLEVARTRVNRVHLLNARHLISLGWVLRLRCLLHWGVYDVVHVHSPAVAVVVRLVVRTMRNRPSIVSTEHNVSYRPLTTWANRLTIHLDDHVVAVSSAVAEGSAVAQVSAKSSVVVHGVDLSRIDELLDLRQELLALLHLAPGLRVVTVANLRPQKQLETLLKAVPIVLHEISDVHFYIAGSGPEEASLKALMTKLQIEDHVTLLGSIEEAARLTSCADLFALSSMHEGLPVAIMEALACGVPVVSTDAGGIKDLVRDGETGILLPVGDFHALATALIRLLSSADERRSFGEAARASRDTIDLRKAAATIAEIYRQVTAARH